MNIFVTAIHTDSGKTLVSAILCEAMKADYWKPVQAGTPADSDTIRQFLGQSVVVHKESYALRTPESPHAAAKKDDVQISLNDIQLPKTSRNLVIEGAGGVLVPLNNRDFVIDIARQFPCEVVLVSNVYLGSINHTLLTVEALRGRGITIAGIVFNGKRNDETEDIILHHSKAPCLLRIPVLEHIDKKTIEAYATLFNESWNNRTTRI
jgi:dethiobiotin synthetase